MFMKCVLLIGGNCDMGKYLTDYLLKEHHIYQLNHLNQTNTLI